MATIRRLVKFLLLIVALLLVIAYLLPRRTEVARWLTMQAPPSVVFSRLNTFQGFNEYSPWYDLDPQAKYAWSGPLRGVGARMTWDSNNAKVGHGSQEIIASEPSRRVVTRLDLGSGGRSDATWLIEPVANGSKVRWMLTVDAGMNPIVRWFGLFLDRMVGPDFAKGLARLKIVVERDASKVATSSAAIEVLDMAAMDIAYLSTQAENTPDKAKISAEFARAYAVIGAFLAANKLQMSGAPMATTRTFDKKVWVFDPAIPVSGAADALTRAAKAGGAVRIGKSFAGKAVRAVHVGPYATLEQAYGEIQSYLHEHGLNAGDPPWEQYINDPGNTPQDKLVTYVFWPIKTP